MRTVLVGVVIVLVVRSLQASTISGRLVETQDAVDQTLWHVAVQVSSGQTTNDPKDGGVSGVQFDIISEGHGKSAAVPATLLPTSPFFSKAKTTFYVTGFSTILPDKRDAVPADNPGNGLYDGDGDLDAVFGSIFDTGNFINTTVGRNGLDPVFTTIATVDFTRPVGLSDRLSLVLIGPTYYDYNATGPSFQRPYTEMILYGSPIPEPTSLGLMALSGIALLAFKLRRPAK